MRRAAAAVLVAAPLLGPTGASWSTVVFVVAWLVLLVVLVLDRAMAS